MGGFVVSFLVGVICVVLGISNRRGNISSLHSYHRNRVTEEDRIPFGKLVGLGMIIMGVGIMVLSVLSAVSVYTEQEIYLWIGNGVLVVSLIVGLWLSFYAMKKYNKGIF